MKRRRFTCSKMGSAPKMAQQTDQENRKTYSDVVELFKVLQEDASHQDALHIRVALHMESKQ